MVRRFCFFVSLSLVVACGGSDGESEGPPVETALFGVYSIDRWVASPAIMTDPDTMEETFGDCADLSAPAPGETPAFVALFNIFPASGDPAVLGGAVCATREDCLEIADLAPEFQINYAFQRGGDTIGWTGGAVLQEVVLSGDQCSTRITLHSLSANGDEISITSITQDVIYEPRVLSMATGMAECERRDSINPNLETDLGLEWMGGPCLQAFEVDATLDTAL